MSCRSLKQRRVPAAVAFCFGALGASGDQNPEWLSAKPDYQWSFPRDHWAHPGYQTEWWYFTGHLVGTGGVEHRFGYQFTFFRVGIASEDLELASAWATPDLIMGHAAVTDLTEGRHVFSELLYRTTPFLGGFSEPGDSVVAWARAPAGTAGSWTLRWNGNGFDLAARDDAKDVAFQLRTHSRKPLILQGPNGYSRKGAGPTAASMYYSLTRLDTRGTLEIGGRRFQVRGESWMDKEFGSNQLEEDQVGWDWFSLQLASGRELMLYRLRNASGETDFGVGTIVARDGTARYLEPSEWDLAATAWWRSTRTRAVYPARWRLSIPSEDIAIDIEPLLSAQENVSSLIPELFYWEGAALVRDFSGAVQGRGYVELTGYGTGRRPAI